MKFKRIPETIDAIQFIGSVTDIGKFVNQSLVLIVQQIKTDKVTGTYIKTKNGLEVAYITDWIIKESNGDIWICKHNEFVKKFTPDYD